MIIECPDCGTYYDTPAIIPSEGRKVRCAKCANVWLALPPPEMDEHSEELVSEPDGPDEAEVWAGAEAEDGGPVETPDAADWREEEPEFSTQSEQVELDDAEDADSLVDEAPQPDLSMEADGIEPDDREEAEYIDEIVESLSGQTERDFSEADALIASALGEIEDKAGADVDDLVSGFEVDGEAAVVEEEFAEGLAAGSSPVDEDGEEPILTQTTGELPDFSEDAADEPELAEDVRGEPDLSEDTSEEPIAGIGEEAEGLVSPGFVSEGETVGQASPLARAQAEATGEPTEFAGVAKPGMEAGNAEETSSEPMPPEESLGDFSHGGIGPARSPMQEIMQARAKLHTPGDPDEVQSPEPEYAEQEPVQEPVQEPGDGDDDDADLAAAGDANWADILAGAGTEAPPADTSDHEFAERTAISRAESPFQAPARNGPEIIAPASRPALASQPSTGELVSWAALSLLVVFGFTLAVVNREAVVRTMPGAASFYSALGMGVNLRGLDFQNVASAWSVEAGRPVLEISGVIANVSEDKLEVPKVVFALQDEDGKEVLEWSADVRGEPLGAGERAPFATRIPSPPETTKSVQVRFAEAQ